VILMIMEEKTVGQGIQCLAYAAIVVVVTMVGSSNTAQAQSSYGVFCANGRIEIDGRSEDEMRSQRGACQFGRFPLRSDAENFARRNFNGVGSSCSCR
jgi:hypothetical protein